MIGNVVIMPTESAATEAALACATCPVCFECCTPGGKLRPLLLPCGHSFCAACVRKVRDTAGALTCPTCRRPAERATRNIALEGVLEALGVKRVPDDDAGGGGGARASTVTSRSRTSCSTAAPTSRPSATAAAHRCTS